MPPNGNPGQFNRAVDGPLQRLVSQWRSRFARHRAEGEKNELQRRPGKKNENTGYVWCSEAGAGGDNVHNLHDCHPDEGARQHDRDPGTNLRGLMCLGPETAVSGVGEKA